MTPTRQWIRQNNSIRTTHSQVPWNERLWRNAMGGVKRYPYFIRRTDLICLSLSISLHVLCAKRTKEEVSMHHWTTRFKTKREDICAHVLTLKFIVESPDTSFSRHSIKVECHTNILYDKSLEFLIWFDACYRYQ